MVTISAPSSSPERMRQEFTGLPLSRTVQAPQSPVPQPSLVPVRPISSRSRSKRRRCAGISRDMLLPFNVILIFFFMLTSIPSLSPLRPRNWAGTLGRSVEQGAFGHSPDHRPPVFGRGAYVADGLAFSSGLCAGFFRQLFRQDLLFDKGLRLSRPHGSRRDRSEGDPYRFTSTLFPA